MHLAINATEVGRRRGGNESYLLGLLDGLASCARYRQTRVTLLMTPAGLDPRDATQIPAGFAICAPGPYRRLAFFLYQQTWLLRRLQPDWYLSTFFLPPVVRCKTAVLVHDLSFRAHPEYFPRGIALYMRVLTGRAIRQADLVVALSAFTQREIARFHPDATGKTVVVYPGVQASFMPQPAPDDLDVLDAYHLTPGYILAMGNIHPRKNLARLLDAYELLRKHRPDVPRMAWVGLPRWDSGGLVERARAAGVELPGFVPQADLPAVYRGASLLVYPSLYEGFGLPPVEAMACGTPAIAADSSSLPEAVGKAGLRVDPYDSGALAEAMERVLADPELRLELRAAGLEQARRFRWGTTAERILAAMGQAQTNTETPPA